MRFSLALSVALLCVGCSHRIPPQAPPAAPHYVIGAAYQLNGTWHYPLEQFEYDETGLAERLPDRIGLSTDGELADPLAMAGAHPTLQLPAIVDVTNLDNGRQIRVRLTDRGPANPGRLIGLTRKAADLLGLSDTGAVPVRVVLDSAASQGLRDRLGGAPKGITAAPVTEVSTESLPPPGKTLSRVAGATSHASNTLPDANFAGVLEPLPQTVRNVAAQPGRLWVRAGRFTSPRYAEIQKNKLLSLDVQVKRENDRGQSGYVVMAGPFTSVAAADAGLDLVRHAGVTDATIVVE